MVASEVATAICTAKNPAQNGHQHQAATDTQVSCEEAGKQTGDCKLKPDHEDIPLP
jgi:hypothetical protein